MSNKLRVQELRDELAKRGLDTTGLKPALVARLDAAIEADDKDDKQDTDDIASDNGKSSNDDEKSTNADKNDKKASGKKTHARDDDDDQAAPPKRVKLEDVNAMLVTELKDTLADMGCSTAGAKAALKKRLIAALKAQEKKAKGVATDGNDGEDNDKKLVTATKKGRAILDPNLPETVKNSFHVIEDGEDVYDAMLNQTNVGGNNNKYYVIQALERDAGGQFYIFTRWGRVGAKGQSKLSSCSTRFEAIRAFESAFHDKTKNDWDKRKKFEAYPGKYTWLEMDYEETNDKNDAAKENDVDKKPRGPSKLKPEVEKLIQLICNINMMKQQMMEIGYDAKKMPLGKLSKSTILRGYEVLKRIAAALDSKATGSVLAQLSSEFYTTIPHDFGFKNMSQFVISDPQVLKKKLEMVEALGEIELASKILNTADDEDDPAYGHYEKLKCKIEPMPMDSPDAAWIKEYVSNTHAETHGAYSLQVEQIYDLERENEDSRFKPFADEKNRMLLWHGSRLCNWTGILSQGLRIAPPEAPVTGYMFGKGVYFADMVSKSANYCYTSPTENTGILLLCEVALGDMRELTTSDYNADKLPPGLLSTKGVGNTAPDPKQFKTLDNGVVVPMGKPKKGVGKGGYLLYNEFIVYNTAQIRMKYLLLTKFVYKNRKRC
ncbi:poly [ADP-ribose] polymerase 2/3/4 [Marchantia polymorpha subsp. ruderalis]|uniref:Poly [ADP-ribose] polymerase n=4 Tax=Marchantia polymorpha TaxID=3197 RepID=A0AAF6BVV1_MARPO|nr:hypothetical protein MARPO_0074s0022 [Marchantia polymorpha]BBN16135.1 hypothetical protein Mp_7g03750 [Marchantia polymorpha subsp. ruderalis]PTQ35028.1 hypothetical protein MARPO_0074s0022 [Marchantia polymorpha]PTQ35030.1 hypothetical protein MARPO_0074s0022 [Marchantia polymorpha]BBN16136.1 hypothetical protein Mp_7g03750 [Marchantia polymorpha subsp. ruderalis]|eukprot:PTQ35027.1 hypothetical protein MARPO_0074s0022 [Marchantia polymorpha]